MNFFKKFLDFISSKTQKRSTGNGSTVNVDMDKLDISQLRELTQKEKLTSDLDSNLSIIKKYFGNSSGLVVREIMMGRENVRGLVLFIEGMVNTAIIDEVVRSLIIDTVKTMDLPEGRKELFYYIKQKVIPVVEINEVGDLEKFFNLLLFGDTAVLIENIDKALLVGTKGWKTRQIQESEAETVVRGSRESFIESIHDNLALIRRRIPIPQLWVEMFTIGSLTKTRVALVYIKGLAGEDIIKEARNRLEKIDTDRILESGDVEGFIEDCPFTVFPLMQRTERADWVEGSLLEGQFAVLTDGSPFVLLAPATFFSMLQSPEDHFEKTPVGTFLRLLRFIAITVAAVLPGFYVAVVNYHVELLPTDLLVSIMANREGVPFPVVFELFVMESVFEVLREAGIRLPTTIGPAISIVGALVLGDAAIRAGLVSPPVVIVVALTAIASFVVPNYAVGIAGRLIRFLFVVLGAVFGIFGIQAGTLLLIVHLCSLRSFGVPYMAPAAPLVWRDMKDHLFRTWIWDQETRPRLIGFREPLRQSTRQQRRYFKILPRKKGDEQDES